MNAPAPPTAPPPAAFAALHNRDFRWFFVGNMLSMMADNIEHVISYWVIYQLFRSELLNGFAVISHWLPFLAMSWHHSICGLQYRVNLPAANAVLAVAPTRPETARTTNDMPRRFIMGSSLLSCSRVGARFLPSHRVRAAS